MVLAQPEAFFTILIATILVSLISSIAHKYTTDQKKMKRIKEKVKELQKEIKEARGDQDRILKINAQIMKQQNDLMMQSMRPMIFTFLPIIIIFIYLQANVAFTAIAPGEEFSIVLDYRDPQAIGDVEIVLPESMMLINRTEYERRGFLGFGNVHGELITIRGPDEPGDYTLIFGSEDPVNRTVLITEGTEYESPSVRFSNSPIQSATIQYDGLRILDIEWLPRWLQGWLAVYIILALILTNVFRRLLKVH